MSAPLAQYSLCQVRAWAEANIISTARYVEEVERRRAQGRSRISETLMSIAVANQIKEDVVSDYHDDCV